jgi:hypothetical protein
MINKELLEALKNVTVHLIAAHSLLKLGGKKAAASDTIFKMMLDDYEKSFEVGRAAIAAAKQSAVSDPVAYIRKDQLQKAAQMAMLCEVTPEPRQDRIGIYTTPPASPLSAFQVHKQAYQRMNDMQAEIDRLKAGTPAAVLLSDGLIDAAALNATGFDGCGTQPMNAEDIRRIVRAAIAKQPAAPLPEPLTDEQIYDWWASENGLEDCNTCKLADFTKVVQAVEKRHNIGAKK